jgi:protein TonB
VVQKNKSKQLLKIYFMLPEKIMQSDLLDILFENRNKAYGAYALRRSYNKRIVSALTITLFISACFSLFQLMHYSKHRDVMQPVIIAPYMIFSKTDDIKPAAAKPAAQKLSATRYRQVISTPPVIVNNDVKTDMPTVDETDKSMVGPVNMNGVDATGEVQPPAEIKGDAINESKAVETKIDDSPLYTAQVMPEYPGGLDALRKFMLRNLKQPDDLQAGEKIIVMASFVVNKNGRIEQVKIISNGRDDLNKEVERVINKMPAWKPGMQNGNTVAVYFNLPVTFMSEEEQ